MGRVIKWFLKSSVFCHYSSWPPENVLRIWCRILTDALSFSFTRHLLTINFVKPLTRTEAHKGQRLLRQDLGNKVTCCLASMTHNSKKYS